MNKVYIQNLSMMTTNRCNLECEHCMRGCKNSDSMSKEVIEATLSQIIGIGNLGICGGEPTLALDVLEYLFTYIVDNKIILEQFSTTINGTNYSLEFLRLLDYINDYINKMHFRKNRKTMFTISHDIYHKKELERLDMMEEYIENAKKYMESPYFYNFRQLDLNLKLFREGNAENLDSNLTIPLKPIDIVACKAGLWNIGPLISVNVKGTITECNASIEHQETLYNYGNVLNDSIEEVALSRARVIKPRKWLKETNKIIKDYTSYNK